MGVTGIERRHRPHRSRKGPCACETCGAPFTPTRSDGRYCSSPCRQKAYRQRAQSHVLDLAEPSSQGNGKSPFRLTPETREWLRREIDRRTPRAPPDGGRR